MIKRLSRICAKPNLLLLGNIAVCFLVFAALLWRLHFSVDSYSQIDVPAIRWHLSIGRYVTCLVAAAVNFFGFNAVLDQRLFLAIWALSMGIAITIITRTFQGIFNLTLTRIEVALLNACVTVAFINVFYMELILFPEIALSLAVGNIALALSISLFLKPSFKHRAESLILLLIALGTYQSFLGYFVAFTFVGALLRYLQNRTTKSLYTSWGITFVFAGIGSVANVLIVKFFLSLGLLSDSGRGAVLSPAHIMENLQGLLFYQKDLLNNADGLLPSFSLAILMLVSLVILVFLLRKSPAKDIVLFIFAFAVSYLFAFAPHIIESNFLTTPRSNVAFWAVVSCYLFIPSLFFALKNQRKVAIKLFTIPLICLLVLLMITIQDMANDTFLSNESDRVTASLIDDRLDAYEEYTGIRVAKIAIEYDEHVTMKYSGVRYQRYEYNRKILLTGYSNYHLINYVGGRSLEKIEMSDAVFAEYFAGRDWKSLNLDEQLVIVGDTAYLIMF